MLINFGRGCILDNFIIEVVYSFLPPDDPKRILLILERWIPTILQKFMDTPP
jgi:hypothetical protein